MKQLTDERIMAYVDGELTPAETEEIRDAVQKDPEALKRAEMFKESAAMLQGVYDAPLNQTIPERLINIVRQNRSDKTGGRVVDFLTSLFRWPQWSPAYGMALTITLILGISAGYLASRWTLLPPTPNTALFVGQDFSRGLETTISGQIFTLADGTIKITPIATFQDPTNRYCRQYEVTAIDSENDFSRGIACRAPSGQWLAIVHLMAPPADQRAGNSADYVPAGRDDVFDHILEKTMAAPPLTLEQEAALIDHAWQ